jgi:hypothetical protein
LIVGSSACARTPVRRWPAPLWCGTVRAPGE